MNKLFLKGRLTKNPEIKYSGDKPIARYSIAVDRKYKDSEGNYPTDFFNITSFGTTASFIEKYVAKGTQIIVEGELQNNNYTDKNGNKVYQNQIIGSSVEFCGSKKDNQEQRDYEEGDGFNPIEEDADTATLPFI